MTELEKVIHAKSYLDQLAQGIDPISGEIVSEDSVLDQVRLARCFFYVSSLLQQIIDNGGQVGSAKREKKAGKPDFFLTEEQKRQVPYSADPIPVTRIVEFLNGMIDLDAMKKLPLTAVTGWLLYKGFLEEEHDASGKLRKRPTEAGAALGITEEVRNSVTHGPYVVVLYDMGAQEFIVDALEEIMQWHAEHKAAAKPAKRETQMNLPLE